MGIRGLVFYSTEGWANTQTLQKTTQSPSSTRKHRGPQLWPFIMVCWTLMLTVNPTWSNLLTSLDTVAAVALDNTIHTHTVCVCVSVFCICLCILVCFHVHPCVHTCNVCLRVFTYGYPKGVHIYVCTCAHEQLCWEKLCPGQICVLKCLYLSIYMWVIFCCMCVRVCVCVFFAVWGQLECSEKSVS